LLRTEEARTSAIGAGLLLSQGVGLSLEEGLQGALGEAGGGSECDLLHGVEIDVESGPVVAEGASGDDFAPLGGEVVEFLEFFGGQGAACHAASCVEVKRRTVEKVDHVRIWPRTSHGKAVHDLATPTPP
jgi:hypothetical protein